MEGSPLAQRLVDLLVRQADRKDAPAWLRDVLAGRAEPAEVRGQSDTMLLLGEGNAESCEIRVQLVLPPRPAATRGPWAPRGLGIPRDELAGLSYVVVDEIVDEAVDVSVSAWPDLDERGRLAFRDESSLSVAASARALHAHLAGALGELPRLRMGDAFAARTPPDLAARIARRRTPLPPPDWLLPPIRDLRTPARAKAKEAFFAAVAPTLTPEQAEAMKRVEPSQPGTP